MKHLIRTGFLACLVILVGCNTESVTGTQQPVPLLALDDFGYNDVANVFVGTADGVDRTLDGKFWGDPTYANDHLVMKWNAAWEKCNIGRTAVNCTGAWINNEWNGQVLGGSGEIWHYKIVWTGPCGVTGTPTPDGGYCIWDDYKVIYSAGTLANQHFWDAHAKPNGLGLKP